MTRKLQSLALALVVVVSCALSGTRALAQANVTNAQVLAVNVTTANGPLETGTVNTQFIFRCTIDFGTNNSPPNFPRDMYYPNTPAFGSAAAVFIDPPDPANPERASTDPNSRPGMFPLQLLPGQSPFGAQEYVAYVTGGQMGWRKPVVGTHQWSLVARNDSANGMFKDGVGAAPKPASILNVVNSGAIEIVPVDQNYNDDKRLVPGQPGNGLRLDPEDPTAPNDGGSASFYTWRVRVRTSGGLPVEFFHNRSDFEWRDYRRDFDTSAPVNARWNSGLILVLVDPQGNPHYCPMELDPNAPNGNNGATQTGVYTLDTTGALATNTLLHPSSAASAWDASTGAGVYFRYRMMPDQYSIAYFGDPKYPALDIGTQQIGGVNPNQIIGRPLANMYTAFAGAAPGLSFPVGPTYDNKLDPSLPGWPYATSTAAHAGQWTYFFICTTDLHPVGTTRFPTGVGDPLGYPNDQYGNPGAYFPFTLTDFGSNFRYPHVTPILSDGGWTDDLPENRALMPAGYPLPFTGTSQRATNAHRSRATNKTKVRYMVRVTKDTNVALPAQAVRVYIDGVPHSMQTEIPGDTGYDSGVVFYYDTILGPGNEGPHNVYFQVDDGNHTAIWPRRPTDLANMGGVADPEGVGAVAGNTSFFNIPVGNDIQPFPYVNHRPTLSNQSVSPVSGVEAQPYTYTVTYTDADNDDPTDAWVYIDGNDQAHAHRMTPVNPGTPASQGRQYAFTLTQLTPTQSGKHFYFFQFRDNWSNTDAIHQEYGEWVTLPSGDDQGNPSSFITGPTITSNDLPTLTDPQYFFGDPAQTSATLYDFAIRYHDNDNEAPASLKVFLSADGGNTWDAGTPMVPAENSTNYVAGVQFHLPNRVRLPVSQTDASGNPIPYRYRFDASDGVRHDPLPPDQTQVHVGTGPDAIGNGTAHTLAPTDAGKTIFVDPLQTGTNVAQTKKWTTDSLFVWRQTSSGGTVTNVPLVYNGAGPNGFQLDAVNGQIKLNQAAGPNDTIKASYYYQDTIGPVVHANHAPTLTEPKPGDQNTNNGTLTPLSGGQNTSFTYSIIYTDADNQPPAYINVVIDTSKTNAMTIDPAFKPPIDYTRGVRYNFTIDGKTLGNGNHTYHFEASDGADTARQPAQNDYTGPLITTTGDLHLPPFGPYNDKPITPFPKGKSNDSYVFTVVYQNSNGLAPPPGTTVQVHIKNNATGTITDVNMSPIDPIGPSQYQTGVRYQVQLTAPNPPLTIGAHDCTFGFSGAPPSTAPLTLIVNGPPSLSNPQPAAGSTFSQAGDATFSVVYSDPNNDAPSPLTLTIDPGTPNAVTLSTTNNTLTAASGQTNYAAGVTFTGSVPASQLSVGTHTYVFTASDGLESAPQTAPVTFAVKAAGIPTLSGGSVTPTTGKMSGSYQYSVTWKHPDNIPPTGIQVIIDPGANQQIQNMTATPGQTDYAGGVTYTYTTTPGSLAAGVHHFYFRAWDRLGGPPNFAPPHTVFNSPDGTANTSFTGPTVNFPPALSNPTAQVVGGQPSSPNTNNTLTPPVKGTLFDKYQFTVTYRDQDNVAPTSAGFVHLIIDTTTFNMHPASANPDYTQPVVYVSDQLTLGPGPHTFGFQASDGIETASLPSATATKPYFDGLSVGNVPVLSAPQQGADDGTLTPRSGPGSTVFTYKIVYTHGDNVAPQSVRVIIDGTAYSMTPASASTTYSQGVLYQYQFRFNSGTTHNYRFEANDTVTTGYTAYYPPLAADGSKPVLNGPTVNLASFAAPTFTGAGGGSQLVAGSPVTVSSQLIAQGNSNQTINIQVVKPDGTGFNATATTDANGKFSYTFTPDQTGDWSVQLAWAGTPGVYDPVSSQFPFRVTGFTMSLPGSTLDMIASPLIPVSPDWSVSFGVTDTSGNPLPVTTLDLIKWVPSPPPGSYKVLNVDGSFPSPQGGQSYWVKPSQSVVLNPHGKIWDQTQPYTISLDPGWNMIGSVYLTDTLWSAVKVNANGQQLDLASAGQFVRPVAWTYDPASGSYTMVQGDAPLHTGRGYWVHALQSCQLVLSPPGTRAVVATRAAVDTAGSLEIAARMGTKLDKDNYVPLNGDLKTRLALSEKPPYVGDYVSVRLLDSANVNLTSTRVAAPGATVIPFQVDTNQKNADITVEFPNLGTLGRRYDVTIVDLATNNRRAAGSGGGYTFNSGDAATSRQFAVLVTARTMNSALRISDVETVSRSVTGSTFSFNVNAPANVHAEILSGAGGRVVRDISTGRAATAGVNTIQWDGKNSQGISMPAGIYLLRLTATDDEGHSATAAVPVTLVR